MVDPALFFPAGLAYNRYSMKPHPRSSAWSLPAVLALSWIGIPALAASPISVHEPFDYDLGVLGDAQVTGKGLEEAWFANPQRPHGASLKIEQIAWSVPSGYESKTASKGLGGEIKGEAAVLLQQPVDFETKGEIWFSFLYRRPDNVAGSVGLFSLSNGRRDIARLWQTVGGGGVTAGLGVEDEAKSTGDFFPKRGQDVLVVGRLRTAFTEPDSLALQVTAADEILPLSFTEQTYVEAPVHGVANWLRFWNFTSEPATEAFFGNLVFGTSYDEVTGVSAGQ